MSVSQGNAIAARRLRVGYVSPDFWMHPVARFMMPVLEHHDRSRFEVFAYPSRYLKDGLTIEIDPPDAEELPFCEQPLRLPRCWWSFSVPPPVVTIPAVVPPPCLSQGVISFGSLNNFVKVNEGVRALWAELVASVPGSRLVLHIKETRARQGLLDFFAERGVASDRVTLIGYQNGPDYMATYGQIDIALDTTPFAGGTTSFDALSGSLAIQRSTSPLPSASPPTLSNWRRSAAACALHCKRLR